MAGVTNQPPQNNPILTRFRVALAEMYGGRLGRAVLFNSRARGDHHPDSNYDAAVFIKDPGTLTEEPDKLASLTTAILLDNGDAPIPTAAGKYRPLSRRKTASGPADSAAHPRLVASIPYCCGYCGI
jgi:uncharacterized protein